MDVSYMDLWPWFITAILIMHEIRLWKLEAKK